MIFAKMKAKENTPNRGPEVILKLLNSASKNKLYNSHQKNCTP